MTDALAFIQAVGEVFVFPLFLLAVMWMAMRD